MSRYAQRLTRVARAFGCPLHEGERLYCGTCDVHNDLTAAEAQELSRLLDTLRVRVNTRSMQREPTYGACRHCGAGLLCPRCNHRNATRITQGHLHETDQARLFTLLGRMNRLKATG